MIGDFGILVRSGFTAFKDLFFNFLSALVALAGTPLRFFFLETANVTTEAYSHFSTSTPSSSSAKRANSAPMGFSGKISPHTWLNANDLPEYSTTRYLHTPYGLLNPIHHACQDSNTGPPTGRPDELTNWANDHL
ncbi:hypothetical protein LXL04_012376 [Taraxacum kok-saghyz]